MAAIVFFSSRLDINNYMSFIFKSSILVSILFELPIIMVILTLINIISPTTLRKYRRYFYISAFILAMFITPPDIIFQILVGIPIVMLFEIGLIMMSILI